MKTITERFDALPRQVEDLQDELSSLQGQVKGMMLGKDLYGSLSLKDKERLIECMLDDGELTLHTSPTTDACVLSVYTNGQHVCLDIQVLEI